MPTISVLTAAQQSRREFLIEAGLSVASQRLPPGWELEWVIQEDGERPSLAADITQFTFAKYQPNQHQCGEGQTRNFALSRAQGELVHVLDSDDLLLPNALATAINTFQQSPQIHWAAAQADDLLPDGQRVAFPLTIPAGPIDPGAISDYMCAGHQPYLPIHTAGLTIRTTTARALGGWGARHGEDGALMAALAELTPGYLLPTVTWLYRKHPQQLTASDDWTALGPEIAVQRITAIRELGLIRDVSADELV